jgi:hypothetical protein
MNRKCNISIIIIKIAILGNSLTLIPGWNGGAGLTASDKEHDHVHILLNKLNK